jgi:para-aminobenzoate synthetase component 2
MAIRHVRAPLEGVQFHPESILTEHGKLLLDNWLRAVGALAAATES